MDCWAPGMKNIVLGPGSGRLALFFSLYLADNRF